jgi:hypothetical protein
LVEVGSEAVEGPNWQVLWMMLEIVSEMPKMQKITQEVGSPLSLQLRFLE